MRVLKIFFIPLISLFLIFSLSAQNSVEKTLVKSFNLEGNDVLDLDLEGNVEINQWKAPTIRVEMLVSLENGNETMLKSLIKAGRYNLRSVQTSAGFKVFMPGLEREIKVRGEALRDNVSYVVSVPSDVIIANDIVATKDKD